jgi:Co/Zn/Cd efflux system component
MRSSWVCSRNDLFANSGVIAAGVLVMITGSVWPDVIVGFAIAVLFLQSSVGVLSDAWHRYAESGVPADSTASETRPY